MRTPPRLLPALITPFDRRGDLDLGAHRHNVTALAERGISGFLVAGSTGEGSLLDPGERTLLIEAIRSDLGTRTFVIAGIWAESVRQALAQIAESDRAGADAVLVVTPTTLARRSVAVQVSFFEAIAKQSPLPVLLYSVPPNTGYSLDLDATIALSQLETIVGMKDSGGDAVRIQRIIEGAPDDFLMFNGATRSVALAVIAGAHGAITASTNFVPDHMADLVATTRRSPRKGLDLQPPITAVASDVESHGIPGVKVAAEAIGLRPGLPRLPFKPLPRAKSRMVAQRVQAFDR